MVKKTVSILPELMSGTHFGDQSSPISTFSKNSNSKMPAFTRLKSPFGQVSGSFVETLDGLSNNILITLSYDPAKEFVAADIFKAFDDRGDSLESSSFQLLTTIHLDKSKDNLTYADHDVDASKQYYYYAIFFDTKIRFSDRTEVARVNRERNVTRKWRKKKGGQEEQEEDGEILRIEDAVIDKGSGDFRFPFYYSKPEGQDLRISKVILLNDDDEKIGETDEVSQPITADFADISKTTHVKFKLVDTYGQFITLDGDEVIKTQLVKTQEFEQSLGTIIVESEYENKRMKIVLDPKTLNSSVAFVMITKRNLTTGEIKYTMPDPFWTINNYEIGLTENIIYDRNVYYDDNYEYKFVGYDDNGNVVGTLLRMIRLKDPTIIASSIQPALSMMVQAEEIATTEEPKAEAIAQPTKTLTMTAPTATAIAQPTKTLTAIAPTTDPTATSKTALLTTSIRTRRAIKHV